MTDLETHQWQVRVCKEKEQLDDRLNKLQEFLRSDTFLSLDRKQRFLMRSQEQIMMSYSHVLRDRIELFS